MVITSPSASAVNEDSQIQDVRGLGFKFVDFFLKKVQMPVI